MIDNEIFNCIDLVADEQEQDEQNELSNIYDDIFEDLDSAEHSEKDRCQKPSGDRLERGDSKKPSKEQELMAENLAAVVRNADAKGLEDLARQIAKNPAGAAAVARIAEKMLGADEGGVHVKIDLNKSDKGEVTARITLVEKENGPTGNEHQGVSVDSRGKREFFGNLGRKSFEETLGSLAQFARTHAPEQQSNAHEATPKPAEQILIPKLQLF